MLHQIAARENHEQTAVDYSQVCTASELDCFKQSSFQAPFDVGRGCHERSRWECLAVTIFCHALLRLPLVRLKKVRDGDTIAPTGAGRDARARAGRQRRY